MKSTATPVPSVQVFSWADWMELSKARLTFMVMLSALSGFMVGSPDGINWSNLLVAMTGIALTAASAAMLNQCMEIDSDARMNRTHDRPLPTGRIKPVNAIGVGVVTGLLGTILLAWVVNGITSLLCALTVLLYLFVYTPLKKVTTHNTIIGAIPGAIPPVAGWTAARGELGLEALGLFAILFCWQMPHFLAIAWMHREDYGRGGFKMLPSIDKTGIKTATQAILFTVALLPATLGLLLLKGSGLFAILGTALAWAAFLACGIRFAEKRELGTAKQLFFASLLYLPVVLILLLLDGSRP